MSYALLVVLIGLATYGLGSAVGGAIVAAAWRSSRSLRGLSGARGARLLLALRAFPPAFGLAAALLLAAPAFVAHEPVDRAHGDEIGLGLVLLGLLGFLPVALGLARTLRTLAATRRVERGWSSLAGPLALEAGLPAARLTHPFPVAALSGFFHYRLYLAECVLDSFTPAELQATCAHERAHATSRDNLKALLLRACPDWLALLPLGRELEQAWGEAAEQAADDATACEDVARGVELAGALVKAARLVPPGMRLADAPAASLHGGTLGARVERLLGLRPRQEGGAGAAWALVACLAALLAPLAVPGSSELIHALLEGLVRLAA